MILRGYKKTKKFNSINLNAENQTGHDVLNVDHTKQNCKFRWSLIYRRLTKTGEEEENKQEKR